MNNARTTKEIKTSGGHTVVLYEYITGREARDIRNEAEAMSKDGKVSMADAVSDVAFKKLVVSIDGSSDDIINKILDLPFKECSEVTDEITSLIDIKKK